MTRARSRALALVVVAVAMLAAACASSASPSTSASSSGGGATATHSATGVTTSQPAGPFETVDYLPGVEADVALPRTVSATAPVVVLVPGGAWRTADRSGLRPLTARLARAGMVVVNATHRAAETGATYPAPVRDVACSVAFAVDRARAAGAVSGPIVVLGHSSGGHLALLLALAPERFVDASCPYPPAAPTAAIGLAGLYDVDAVAEAAVTLFGSSRASAPDEWREGSPMTWAGSRPSLPALLAHGDADQLVPMAFTTTFARALETGGHPVSMEIIPGAGHHELYRADVIGPIIERWVATLPARP